MIFALFRKIFNAAKHRVSYELSKSTTDGLTTQIQASENKQLLRTIIQSTRAFSILFTFWSTIHYKIRASDSNLLEDLQGFLRWTTTDNRQTTTAIHAHSDKALTSKQVTLVIMLAFLYIIPVHALWTYHPLRWL